MSFTTVYERDLEIPIKISKSASEDARRKRLERWPREPAYRYRLTTPEQASCNL
ncbi:hypothetical protein [Vulcanisaeta souniana]|uniref:hypothetical protein n=1 Tax=Vulcanisaeta souniana TaxID=164452 RepID=UPI000B2E1D2A|nr:hypothetical protein [Vulcanisaeta souniana]